MASRSMKMIDKLADFRFVVEERASRHVVRLNRHEVAAFGLGQHWDKVNKELQTNIRFNIVNNWKTTIIFTLIFDMMLWLVVSMKCFTSVAGAVMAPHRIGNPFSMSTSMPEATSPVEMLLINLRTVELSNMLHL